MTYQDKIDIAVGHVMGWTGPRESEPYEQWDTPPAVRRVWDGGDVCREFDPDNYDDVMRLWFKFSNGRGTELSHIEPKGAEHGWWYAEAVTSGFDTVWGEDNDCCKAIIECILGDISYEKYHGKH